MHCLIGFALLFGNKASRLAQELDVPYAETSAKTSVEALETFAKEHSSFIWNITLDIRDIIFTHI